MSGWIGEYVSTQTLVIEQRVRGMLECRDGVSRGRTGRIGN